MARLLSGLYTIIKKSVLKGKHHLIIYEKTLKYKIANSGSTYPLEEIKD